MTQSKLERLKEMVKRNPDQSFPRYGLAMEYKSQQDYREAIQTFQKLLQRDPDYVAAYYQYGTLLASSGQRDRAEEILSEGVKVADRAGNAHASEELKRALEELGSQ